MASVVLPKVVLITGCSVGGIGAALCEEYARAGCIVYATARRLEAMDGLGSVGDIRKLQLDVTVEQSLVEAVETIIAAEGRIDILVNNAGVLGVGPLLDKVPDDTETVFRTNVFAPLRLAQLVVPHMAGCTPNNTCGTKGLIINIGSIAAIAPPPWDGLYGATKAALKSLTESMYMEFRPLGIRVMLVQAGCVATNIANNYAATYTSPDLSLYSDYSDLISTFIYHSQTHGAIPASNLARTIIRKSDLPSKALLGKPIPKNMRWNPGWYLSMGGDSWAFYLFGWLPRRFVMLVEWQAVGIERSERSWYLRPIYWVFGV
ncbi:NAD(P)-binding protein [Clavulina sp. PMI_390]|nr:NAD(P)-binding protein [Clavulina sp. PMI_390]KAF8310026.1 NAD(P)-binding protein [Clavulina sp. PMI_390]